MKEISLSDNFLCNSFDDSSPNLLHKNSDGQFLCNKTGTNTTSPLHKILGQIDPLPLSDLKELLRYIQSKIDEFVEMEIPVRQDREIVETRRLGAIVYQLEKIKCGKNCRKCPHGPYWYAYYRDRGKVVSKYLGKNLESKI